MIEQLLVLDTGFCQHPECTVMKGGSLGLRRFPSTVLVLKHRSAGIVLFDVGYAPRFHSATRSGLPRFYAAVTPVATSPEQTAVAQLKALGIAAADVRHVVLSHFHADHIAGLLDFPYATVHFHADAHRALMGLSALRQLLAGFLPALLPPDLSARTAVIADLVRGILPFAEFNDGYDLFGDGSVVAVDLPGHALGHLGLVVRRSEGDLFFVADAAWLTRSITQERMPSAVTRLIIADFPTYGATLSRLHRLHQAHPEVKIIPCHCTEANAPFIPSSIHTTRH